MIIDDDIDEETKSKKIQQYAKLGIFNEMNPFYVQL